MMRPPLRRSMRTMREGQQVPWEEDMELVWVHSRGLIVCTQLIVWMTEATLPQANLISLSRRLGGGMQAILAQASWRRSPAALCRP